MWKTIKFNFSLLNSRRYQTANSLINIYWITMQRDTVTGTENWEERGKYLINQGFFFYNSESQWEKKYFIRKHDF